MITITDHFLTVSCMFLGVSQVALLTLMMQAVFHGRTAALARPINGFAIYGFATLLSAIVGREITISLTLFACSVLFWQCSEYFFKNFVTAWHMFMTNMLTGLVVGVASLHYVAGLFWGLARTPGVIELTLLMAVPWGVTVYASTTITATLQFMRLFRKVRRRPVTPLTPEKARELAFYPRVSMHVPCYAEPPEVVIQTIDALAHLDYPNYEVLVVDNNTSDPALWRPLEQHCRKLGEHIRFIHVEGLKGAKGGALNFSFKNQDPTTEIIGIFDSDFICEPDYLLRLVGFFTDPNISFVQTPHDYRHFSSSAFKQSCYWEYRDKHALLYPGMNEWDASPITGTMCLIRSSALKAVNGWSESCLCEDSELSLRLAIAGYAGQYVDLTFGRGLVPETFYGYQRQRFRWVAGTIQQFTMHLKFFLSPKTGKGPRISAVRYVLLVFYRLGLSSGILNYAMMALGAVITIDCVRYNNTVTLPVGFLILIAASFTCRMGFAAIRNKLIGRTFINSLRSLLADAAVTHIRVRGAFQGLFLGRTLAWQRTSKFKAVPSWQRAIRSVYIEFVLGISALLVGILAGEHAEWIKPDVLSMISVTMFLGGAGWLCAPVMALLAELEVRANFKEQLGGNEAKVLGKQGLPAKSICATELLE